MTFYRSSIFCGKQQNNEPAFPLLTLSTLKNEDSISSFSLCIPYPFGNKSLITAAIAATPQWWTNPAGAEGSKWRGVSLRRKFKRRLTCYTNKSCNGQVLEQKLVIWKAVCLLKIKRKVAQKSYNLLDEMWHQLHSFSHCNIGFSRKLPRRWYGQGPGHVGRGTKDKPENSFLARRATAVCFLGCSFEHQCHPCWGEHLTLIHLCSLFYLLAERVGFGLAQQNDTFPMVSDKCVVILPKFHQWKMRITKPTVCILGCC